MPPKNEPGGGSRCPRLIGLFFRGVLGVWFFNGCKPPSRNAARCRSLGFLLGGKKNTGKKNYIKQNRSRNEPRRDGASSACPAGEPRAGPCPRCVQREGGREGGTGGAALAPSLNPPPIAFAPQPLEGVVPLLSVGPAPLA